MANKVFSSCKELQTHLQTLCDQAVKATAEEARQQLSRYINEQSYNTPEFFPDVYRKTYTLLSAAAWQLISKGSAEIYIDGDGMHDENGGHAWEGDDFAGGTARGADYCKASMEEVWGEYVKWCNGNLIGLLKKNLMKVGVSVK